MQIMTRFFSFSASIPSWSSHRFWLLRVGYYKLTRPQEKRDWMRETFGKSARTQRKKAFSTPNNTEQKPDQLRYSA